VAQIPNISPSRFFIEKVGSLASPSRFRCACSRTRNAFRCSGRLCWGFFHSHKLIYGSPTCISALKRCARAHVFAFSRCFARARICATFCCRSTVRICWDECPGIFPGRNNARECARARAFHPRALDLVANARVSSFSDMWILRNLMTCVNCVRKQEMDIL